MCLLIVGCDHNTDAERHMAEAERLMDASPDSALSILDSIDANELSGSKIRARYALLRSMALDRNNIDITTFEVLQPAIDYYLENGTPDEKLRTLYCQGRIYKAVQDYDKAMQAFLKAKELKGTCTDTLTFAYMLVAKGALNYRSYQMEDYVENNQCAAELFEAINKVGYSQLCMMKVLDGSIALGNRALSDSLWNVVRSFDPICQNAKDGRLLVELNYAINFNTEAEIKELLDSVSISAEMPEEGKLIISLGYLSIDNGDRAQQVLEMIDTCSSVGKSFRYKLIKSEVLEANGRYKEALDAYKVFFSSNELENSKIYSQKTTVAQERHDLELKELQKIRYKDRLIAGGLCILLVMVIVVGVIAYYLHLVRTKRIIAEKEKVRLQLENDNLQKQNAVLELGKQNAELELTKHRLETENMRMRVAQLETESEHLKELARNAEQSELPLPVVNAMQERIRMVNSLLASRIADNGAYSKPYEEWIDRVTQDRKHFMDSTRLAFTGSHPKFIKYLEEHGLTESEINYLCLYAIGLKGKEVGEYIQLRRHYNISSEIRRKLGIDEHETNIGIYVRKLMNSL